MLNTKETKKALFPAKLPHLIILCLFSVLLGACAVQTAATAPPQADLRWPPPPAEPRIQWVKEIHNFTDAGVKRGWWQRVVEFVTGERTGNIGKPYGIYCDDHNRLFIVDTELGAVHVMDMKENEYTVIGEEERLLKGPIGITGDGDTSVYITDSAGAAVYRYNLSEKKLRPFVVTGLLRPTGIVYNRVNKLLYVSDTAAHQVVVFDERGAEKFRIGSRGDGPGEFNYPTDLSVDRRGQLYVTDPLNARIQMLTADGGFLGKFGDAGDTIGHFAKPKGVSVDSDGHIYVCDAILDTVQIFDESGQLLLFFGSNGTGPGQFWMPSGLYIDRDNLIYVADSYNRRIQVFRYLSTKSSPP